MLSLGRLGKALTNGALCPSNDNAGPRCLQVYFDLLTVSRLHGREATRLEKRNGSANVPYVPTAVASTDGLKSLLLLRPYDVTKQTRNGYHRRQPARIFHPVSFSMCAGSLGAFFASIPERWHARAQNIG